MRWFSGFAILFYLSLLCMPQAFAVHDANVSPLADSQLQAVPPALQQHLLSQPDDKDDAHSAALLAAERLFVSGNDLQFTTVLPLLAANNRYCAWQARAPPYSHNI